MLTLLILVGLIIAIYILRRILDDPLKAIIIFLAVVFGIQLLIFFIRILGSWLTNILEFLFG
ncbi:TPA: hypothetical protein ACN11Q_002728, partial [Staphylococcus aureus]